VIQLALFRAPAPAVQVCTEQALHGLLDQLARHNHRQAHPPAPSPDDHDAAQVLHQTICDRALICPTDHAALMAWSSLNLPALELT